MTLSAIEALDAHGSDELKKIYLEKLVSGEWTGTRRLEWQGQDGQHETEQPDHSASLCDSITSSTRKGFRYTQAWLLEKPHADWTESAIAAIAWNTFMVSLGGMGLYFAMLVRGTVASTSANFYLVPGTAALLGWLLLGERLSYLALIGLITASVGCWLVNARPGKPLPKQL